MSTSTPALGIPAHRAIFAPTNWTMVRAAGASEASSASDQALAKLCRTYWYPIYAYVRRKGHSVHDAEDLTQAFFAQLMARRSLRQVRGEGKFRSFLLAALEHFLASEWKRAHRRKRGGDTKSFSMDQLEPEARYQLEPADERTAERLYERRWALTVLEKALARLQEECIAACKEALFTELKGILAGETSIPHAELGARLGMSEGAVKVAAYRLRQRYAELVRQQVAETLSDPDDLDEEIGYLFSALST